MDIDSTILELEDMLTTLSSARAIALRYLELKEEHEELQRKYNELLDSSLKSAQHHVAETLLSFVRVK